MHEAHQQVHQGRFAAAVGPGKRQGFARLDREAEPLQHRRPVGISEGHVLEFDVAGNAFQATLAVPQRFGFFAEKVQQPLGGPSRVHDLAVDAGQRRQRAGQQHHVEQQGDQLRGLQLTGAHVADGDPEQQQGAGTGEQGDRRRQQRGQPDLLARNVQQFAVALGETVRFQPLAGEGLQHRHHSEVFVDEGHQAGPGIDPGPRQRTDAPAQQLGDDRVGRQQ